jgi:hypothetical protein
LYQPDPKSSLVVVTAGHHLPTKGVFIETRITKGDKTLCLNAGEFKVFYNYDNIDYAYSRLPIEIIKRDLNKGTQVDYLAYRHQFIRAKKGEAFGFAVWNNYELVKSGDRLLLPRYCCFEIGMELVNQDEHINYFKTNDPLKGDEYYQGASGSPIADPEGAITSILIGCTDDRSFLKGFRLDNVELRVSNGS